MSTPSHVIAKNNHICIFLIFPRNIAIILYAAKSLSGTVTSEGKLPKDYVSTSLDVLLPTTIPFSSNSSGNFELKAVNILLLSGTTLITYHTATLQLFAT